MQGQSVEREADQQRRAARPVHPRSGGTGAFAPVRTQAQPFQRQQRKAAWKVRRARSKLPDNPHVVQLPVFKHGYTPDEIAAIHHIYREGARRAGVNSVMDLYALASPRQQANMRAVSRAVPRSPVVTSNAWRAVQDTVKPGGADRSLAGIPVDKLARELDERLFTRGNPGLRIAKVPFELGEAAVEHPAQFTKTTLRTAIESIAGIPQGVKAIAEHPKQGLKAIAQDYERRYGPIVAGNAANFREQVLKDYGLTPFAADIGGVSSLAGRGLGIVARSGAYGRAVAALRAGVEHAHPGLGGGVVGRGVVRAAEEVRHTATRERPALREFAGEAGARKQETSRNLFVAGGQRALDAERRRAYRARVRRAGLQEAPGGRLRPREGAHGVSRLPALRPGEGEVIPAHSLRDMPLLRRLSGRVARDVGAAKSTTRLRLTQERAKTLQAIERRVGKLSDKEQRPLKEVIELGLPADRDAAVSALRRRRRR